MNSHSLCAPLKGGQADKGPLLRIGDCMAPATIAAAVYDGHRAAREMDNLPDPDGVPFKREQSIIDPP